ncbi:hypothetical protein L593_00825 [Salinarchaeum sp. Harcht-Bsk1]|uniref:hypothetical protein n=1 Tax=Salinarchaeum sp. Harcht-Bsk1 TaxID=1333523 RepID=UPI00034233E1|nr:hypothetical protein [Salinarchaeum sp. Harcht-Bsk1]AGN00120.1 hypothetical protein L593_00825 [Salinarchaeum sp. Harcht-Bsk1]
MSSAGPGRREVAHRLFAAEYDDATLEYAESDEERAPNYVVLPSGARVNRLFVVGVLTAVEQVNDDTVRARIADPTGAFVVYAGQYQPDELAAFQSLEAPAFVAVTGKANTFSPEGSDRVLTSVRPESVTEVDAETRDRWVVATAEHTLARVQTAAEALGMDERGEGLQRALLRDGVEPGLAEGISRAIDHYDTSTDYLDALRQVATQALEVVADERSEVEALDREPAGGDGTTTASDLTSLVDEERLSVTQAAGDVDPDVLLGDEPDGEEPDGEEPEEAEETGEEEEATSGTEATDAETEPAEGGSAEPTEATEEPESSTSEPAGEQTADEDATAADTGADRDEQDSTGVAQPETGEDAPAESATEPAKAAVDESAETEETTEGEEPSESDESEADGELYEVDEAEREQIEEEYGVGFQSGTEVDPAGEAGIETDDTPPGANEGEEPAAVEASDETDGAEAESESVADDDDEDSESEDAESEDVDLEGVLLEEMSALDDGDGADREALIDAVAGTTGADADAIDDAIDDLLMSGQCYEPGDGQLKPI